MIGIVIPRSARVARPMVTKNAKSHGALGILGVLGRICSRIGRFAQECQFRGRAVGILGVLGRKRSRIAVLPKNATPGVGILGRRQELGCPIRAAPRMTMPADPPQAGATERQAERGTVGILWWHSVRKGRLSPRELSASGSLRKGIAKGDLRDEKGEGRTLERPRQGIPTLERGDEGREEEGRGSVRRCAPTRERRGEQVQRGVTPRSGATRRGEGRRGERWTRERPTSRPHAERRGEQGKEKTA